MKGKKFDAAEKHFQKKEESYIKKVKRLEGLLVSKEKTETALNQELDMLRSQNDYLKCANAKLLELCKLSEEDIQASILKDKQIAAAAMVVTRIMGSNM